MRKDIKKVAKRTVAPCKWNASLMVKSGDVDDIITVIKHADEISVGDTERFAKNLRGKDHMITLRNVYDFVRDNIRYVRDPEDEEIIKTPGCTIAEGKGDCKSMTILVGSLLRDLGYSFFYRVAFYDPEYPQQGHIYAIAVIDGKEIVVDPVYHKFNEQLPTWKHKDYSPVANATIGSLQPDYSRLSAGQGIVRSLLTISIIAVSTTILAYD